MNALNKKLIYVKILIKNNKINYNQKKKKKKSRLVKLY